MLTHLSQEESATTAFLLHVLDADWLSTARGLLTFKLVSRVGEASQGKGVPASPFLMPFRVVGT